MRKKTLFIVLLAAITAVCLAISGCDLFDNPNDTPVHTHTYDNGVITAPATCTEKGVMTYTCVDGDDSYTEELPAIGHDYGEWQTATKATCTTAGEEVRVCSHDDSHTETRDIAALGHDLVHHEAKAATCEEIGYEAYDTCSRCDHTTTE